MIFCALSSEWVFACSHFKFLSAKANPEKYAWCEELVGWELHFRLFNHEINKKDLFPPPSVIFVLGD